MIEFQQSTTEEYLAELKAHYDAAIVQLTQERDEWQMQAMSLQSQIAGEVERQSERNYVDGLKAKLAKAQQNLIEAESRSEQFEELLNNLDIPDSSWRDRAITAEAELAKAQAQLKDVVERMGDDIRELRSELAKAIGALEKIAKYGTVAGMHEQDRDERLRGIARAYLDSDKNHRK